MKISVFRKFKDFIAAYFLLIVLVLITAGVVFYFAASHFALKNFDPKIFDIKDDNFERFLKYAQKEGADSTYQVLKQRFPQNEAAAHDLAHIIGQVAFEQKKLPGISLCDTFYNYGCYHGFIETFLAQKGLEAVGEIEKTCFDLGYVHSPSCLHGIGHGLMINSSYNLEKALDDCNRLKESSRIYCFDGVFMERIVASMQDPQNRPKLTEERLDEPCQTIATIYKNQCWRNQVTLWFTYYQNNPAKITARCQKLDLEYQPTCLESIGLINVQNAGENLNLLVNSCLLINNQTSDSCLIGEMKELLFEGKSPQIAQSLCGYVSSPSVSSCQSQFQALRSEYYQRFGR